MNRTLVAAVDCGSTVVKAAVFDLRGRLLSLASRPSPCLREPGGAVLIDPAGLAVVVCACLRRALSASGIRPALVAAVSVTAQRASVIPLDGRGRPAAMGISWQDMRGRPQMERLARRVGAGRFAALTGLPPDAVFTVGKLLHLRHADRALWSRTARFVLVHDYVARTLGCGDFRCDLSNASLTGLLDTRRLDWSNPLLEAIGLARGRLPELACSGSPIGAVTPEAARRTGLPAGAAIVAGGGDQQCAGLGAGAVRPGVAAITLGTAAVPLCASERRILDPRMRLMSCVHARPGSWELEGLQNSAGAALQWMKRLLSGPGRFGPAFFAGVEAIAPGSEGAAFLPYLSGSSAPHWHAEASGAFLGLQAGHGRHHLVRAIMEGVALDTREIVALFGRLGNAVDEVRLTGGCTAIGTWNHIMADVLGVPVRTLENREATAAGAAILAACGIGAYRSVDEAARAMVRLKDTYAPRKDAAAAYARLARADARLHRLIRASGLFAGVAARR